MKRKYIIICESISLMSKKEVTKKINKILENHFDELKRLELTDSDLFFTLYQEME